MIYEANKYNLQFAEFQTYPDYLMEIIIFDIFQLKASDAIEETVRKIR